MSAHGDDNESDNDNDDDDNNFEDEAVVIRGDENLDKLQGNFG